MSTLSDTRVFTSLDSWRDTVATHMRPLEIDADPGEFSCAVRMFETESMQFWDIRSQAHHFERTRAQISSSSSAVSMTVQLEGESVISQNGRDMNLTPGRHAFLNWGVPYSRSFGAEHRMVTVIFSGESLPRSYASNLERLAAGSDRSSGLLDEMVRHFLRVWDLVSSPSDTAVLSSALRSVRSATLSVLSDPQPHPMIAEVQSYILTHLHDPDLTPQQIADAHYISVRHLYNLFAETGQPVSTWIRRQRLERVKDDLHDTSIAVSTIGERWGLPDPSQLTRSFKREFGTSPAGYRRSRLPA